LRVDHDAFATRGLGKNAYRVWRALHTGVGADHLVDHLGLHPGTVRRLLALLDGHGLGAGEQVTTAHLDAVAVEVGTFGRLERLREQHRLEREERRAVVLPMRGWRSTGARWRRDRIGQAERRAA
jgi:hypothetical protein